MDDNHVRFESAISAASKGNLTWEKWPHDMATAVAFASRRNPIGGALYDFYSDPNVMTTYAVVMILATVLGKKGYAVKESREIAFNAHTFYRDHRCQACHGNGVTGISQKQCPSCNGSGDRPMHGDPDVALAVGILMEKEHLLDRQIGWLLKGCRSENNSDGNLVHLPMVDIQSDEGFNRDSKTPARLVGG